MWEPSQLGILCEQTGDPSLAIINRMDDKVDGAGTALKMDHTRLGKTLQLPPPFHYKGQWLTCDLTVYPDMYAAFWYHPDHLGSSSYITNLAGEITQHMEYLPFGETLIEEHLNSNNSPYKFNAKEFDAETGNYYYGARYYDPKFSIWLNVDPLADHPKQIGISPYAYCANNPVIYVDPTGMLFDDYGMDDEGNITLLRETDDNFDRLYNSEDVFVGEVNKGFLSDGINIEKDGLFLDVQNKEDFLSYLSFVTDLSVDVNKEIGGYILDSKSGFDDIYITGYEENGPRSAEGFANFANSDSYNIKNKELNLNGTKHKANSWFHTHPDIMSPGYGSSKPSPADINVTKTLQIPGMVLGGWGGIGLINIDGSYIRWGN